MKPEDYRNWLPVSFRWEHAGPAIEWCHTGGLRLEAPFFDQSVQALMRHPFNQLFRRVTPLDAMEAFAQDPGAARPAGFIFHMSRCGSTLVARMLGALPQSIVLSEPALVEAILYSHIRRPGVGDADRIAWLRRTVGALGRSGSGAERHLFIKFDSWSVAELPLVQAAFPGVPCLFLYRDPVEVMVSHERIPGTQVLPGALEPQLFGLDLQTAITLPAEEYRARVLASICHDGLRYAREGRLRLMNYRELPDAVPSLLQHFFGIPLGEEDLGLVAAAAQTDSKSPGRGFVSDGQAKRHEAGEALRNAAQALLYPVYEELEALRAQQPPLPR